MPTSKNLQKVQDYLKGEHSSQKKKSFNFDPANAPINPKDKNVGDTWEEYDSDGNVKNICTKMEGYILRSQPNHDVLRTIREYLNTYPNCQKEKCDAISNRLNNKYRLKMGMCSDCACKFEDDIKLQGKESWKEYEKSKMLDKANKIFETSDQYLDELVKPIREGYYTEVLPDGKIVKHYVDESIAESIINDYNEYKKAVYEAI